MTHEDALRKAMSCLRLAKSSNPAEAALAAAKAQEIIDKFKLDVTGLDYESNDRAHDAEPIQNFSDDPIADGSQNESRWTLMLASTIAKVNGCRVYYSTKMNKGYRVSIVGKATDVSTARYVFSFIKQQVDALCKAAGAGHSGTWKRHYCIGVVDTVRSRLLAQQKETFDAARKEHSVNPLALVRVNNAIAKIERQAEAVQKWMDDQLKLGKGRGCSLNLNAGGNGLEAGRRDGHKVQFTAARAGIGSGVRQLN